MLSTASTTPSSALPAASDAEEGLPPPPEACASAARPATISAFSRTLRFARFARFLRWMRSSWRLTVADGLGGSDSSLLCIQCLGRGGGGPIGGPGWKWGRKWGHGICPIGGHGGGGWCPIGGQAHGYGAGHILGPWHLAQTQENTQPEQNNHNWSYRVTMSA